MQSELQGGTKALADHQESSVNQRIGDTINKEVDSGLLSVETLFPMNDGVLVEDSKSSQQRDDGFIREDDLQNLTDEEEKGISNEEKAGGEHGDDRLPDGEEAEKVLNGKEKKVGARGNLFVVRSGGAASKKLAQAIPSPREKASVKQGARRGGGTR